jgi:hypothetical protein
MSSGTILKGPPRRRQPKSIEKTGLSTRSEQEFELATSSAEATARYEMEGAIVMARRFPRNEDKAFSSIMKACSRPTFAADCCYSFPRGGEAIEGPSVYLAREAARCWGNIRYGVDIIRDDAGNRQIRGWAWDMETNTRVAAEDSFAKLAYRKKGGWVKPDERELRELTNRRAAIMIRNCILSLIPSDLIEDAVKESKKTLEKGAAANPDEARKLVIKAFAAIGVPVDELEKYLKHPLAQSSPAEIANLRTVYKSISDGNSKWSEYVEPSEKSASNGPVSGESLTNGNGGPPEGNARCAPREERQTESPPGSDDSSLSPLALEFEEKLHGPLTRPQNAALMREMAAARLKLSDGDYARLRKIADENAARLKAAK